MRPWGWIAVASFLLLYLCCGLLAAPMVFFPVELGLTLLFGWIGFLAKVLPSITLDWPGIISGILCLVVLAAGMHWICSWLFRKATTAEASVSAAARTWPLRSTIAILAAFVLMFIAGLAAVGVARQTGKIVTSPEPFTESDFGRRAPRTQSANNLKMQTLAAYNYSDVFKTLPPGFMTDAQGPALHSWQALLLPYLDYKDAFDRIDFTKPWYDPVNQPVTKTKVYHFLYPGEGDVSSQGYGLSHFAGNMYVFGTAKSLRLQADFPDGAATTLLIGEAGGAFKPWGQPTTGRDPGLGLNRSPLGFGDPTGRGDNVNFAFADGSVRALNPSISQEVLRALATPAGGEKLPENWDQ